MRSTSSPSSSTPEPDLFSLSTGDESGYERWQAEMAGEEFEFLRRWGVPLGRRVRVNLAGLDAPLAGLLRHVENAGAPTNRGIWLLIGDHKFHSSQIESVVRIEYDE